MTPPTVPSRSNTPIALMSVAVLALAFPLYAFARWMVIVTRTSSHIEAVERFHQGIPQTLQSGGALEWFSAGLCLVSVVAAAFARAGMRGAGRAGLTALLTLAALLGLWNLFTLM
jgi:hypothetical protein